MKSTIISMFIVLIVLITIPMFLFGDGDLAQKFGFGAGGAAENLRDKTPKNIRALVTDKDVEVYKWKNEEKWAKPPKKSEWGTLITKVAPNNLMISGYKLR